MKVDPARKDSTSAAHTHTHHNLGKVEDTQSQLTQNKEAKESKDSYNTKAPSTRSASESATPTVLPASEPESSAASSVAVPVVATTRTVNVSNDAELKAALAAAQTGDKIQLAAGSYSGPITLTGKKGVTLAGSKDAVINTSSTKKPGFSVTDCSDCSFTGFSVKGGQKGIMSQNSPGCVYDHLDVSNTQMEGVHFKDNSSGVTLQNSSVHDTGLGGNTPAGNNRVQSDDGEGVYVGTAKSNNPTGDETNNVKIVGNTIYNTTAENIDIKEFTQGGTITGNTLDGKGCGSGATANVEVKGSGYTVTGNTITNAYKSGIKNYSVSGVPNSGLNNTINNNTIS